MVPGVAYMFDGVDLERVCVLVEDELLEPPNQLRKTEGMSSRRNKRWRIKIAWSKVQSRLRCS